MEAFFTYGFLQRALLAGIFISIACAMLGVFLILRRDAMIGHGLAHVTFAGVALGLFLNVMPLAMALFIAVAASLVIMKLKDKVGLHGDTAIAIFSSVGFALGVLFATLSQSFNVDLFSYLFGEILAIELSEVWFSVILAAIVMSLVILNYHKFMYMTFDRESARASGIKVNRLDTLLTVLTAVTIVLGMKVVGILLVSALVVIPAAAGLQIASDFRQAIILSTIVSIVSVVLGLLFALVLDLPASGSIVILSFLFFGVFFGLKRIFK
ncbi:MAG: metal ABC transporter permease [Candidatus Aminicenantes bacterium]|nr:metal ABC transporter permease [Candidatus Aminicenantes bacterium]MDH5384865.1 metal ABC transporter permease [Candidatus Aminicenantes bacterium]